ncbi:SnaRE associated Golgi protein [Cardiosporidium cionae]|uniref:SnaRE associated Golgi protein n=1 Tax=Cardiosporidium cionae TaxID=476202 RepID=A0ABQ7JCT3_9APIC|nr:SnaRE associated Golgi protein [Cardiosporidium cionae]|eukprot:KAF8821832.1 SnaRE associated Golgi protein [Cardiosporidium cionae]
MDFPVRNKPCKRGSARSCSWNNVHSLNYQHHEVSPATSTTHRAYTSKMKTSAVSTTSSLHVVTSNEECEIPNLMEVMWNFFWMISLFLVCGLALYALFQHLPAVDLLDFYNNLKKKHSN